MGLLAKHNSDARIVKQNFSTLLHFRHCCEWAQLRFIAGGRIVSTYCPFTAAHVDRGCQEPRAKRTIVALSNQHVGVVAGAG
jgi:hypothetical protein